jgi:hypothetical protein
MRVHQEGQVDGRQLLDRWVERGLIRREQVDHIRVEEGWEPAQPTSVAVAAAGPHGSLIVEALGYLGGVLIVVAASLIANWYWAPHPNLGPRRAPSFRRSASRYRRMAGISPPFRTHQAAVTAFCKLGPRASAAASTDAAKTCEEYCSAEAASPSSSLAVSGGTGLTASRAGCPYVRVPVLSNATVRVRASCSSVPPPLTMMPSLAAGSSRP